jgi:hypothetical protein
MIRDKKNFTSKQNLIVGRIKQYLKDCSFEDLNEKQRDYVCRFLDDFDYEKYWDKLTSCQKIQICYFRDDFDYEKYWNSLNEMQKKFVTLGKKLTITIKQPLNEERSCL